MISQRALELRSKLQQPAGRGGVRLSGDDAVVLDDALGLAEQLVVERQHLRAAVLRECQKVRRVEDQLAETRKQLAAARERLAERRPVF